MAVAWLGDVFQQVLKARHGLVRLLGGPEAADALPIVLDELVRLPEAALEVLVLGGRQQQLPLAGLALTWESTTTPSRVRCTSVSMA